MQIFTRVLLFALLLNSVLAQTAVTLSSLQCTANDVTVIGYGVVTNEPCGCVGTFNAVVNFTIADTASADRYCATIYLCDGTSTGRQLLIPQTVPGKSQNIYSVTLPNYSCDSGLRCFGAISPSGLGQVFPKGAACPTGQCCDTILWNVNSGAQCPAPTPIASQCRHQQVCIQGKQATLTCASNCNTTTCGPYLASLQMCATAIGSTPYTYFLTDGSMTRTRISSNACETFTVNVTQPQQTFRGYIADSAGCQTFTTTNVTLTSIPSLAVSLGVFVQSQGCNGCGTFTATITGGSGAAKSFSFAIDSNTPVVSSSNVFSYTGAPDGRCHIISVNVTEPSTGCSAGPALQRITQCVTTTTC